MCSSVSTIVRCARNIRETVCENCPVELVDLVTASCKDLTLNESKEVRELVVRYYCDVFAVEGTAKGRTSVVTYQIDIENVRQYPRRLPLAKREEADNIIGNSEKEGVIEP